MEFDRLEEVHRSDAESREKSPGKVEFIRKTGTSLLELGVGAQIASADEPGIRWSPTERDRVSPAAVRRSGFFPLPASDVE